MLRREYKDINIRRKPWTSFYHFTKFMYILFVDIQGNHVKLMKLLLFKPKQQDIKVFRWKEI